MTWPRKEGSLLHALSLPQLWLYLHATQSSLRERSAAKSAQNDTTSTQLKARFDHVLDQSRATHSSWTHYLWPRINIDGTVTIQTTTLRPGDWKARRKWKAGKGGLYVNGGCRFALKWPTWLIAGSQKGPPKVLKGPHTGPCFLWVRWPWATLPVGWHTCTVFRQEHKSCSETCKGPAGYNVLLQRPCHFKTCHVKCDAPINLIHTFIPSASLNDT